VRREQSAVVQLIAIAVRQVARWLERAELTRWRCGGARVGQIHLGVGSEPGASVAYHDADESGAVIQDGVVIIKRVSDQGTCDRETAARHRAAGGLGFSEKLLDNLMSRDKSRDVRDAYCRLSSALSARLTIGSL
jgi:hypothetical protein